MKVLMFGWEFPPHITGGLGTACYGLTKGLAKCGNVEIVFVVPKLHGDEDKTNVALIGAGEISITRKKISLTVNKPEMDYFEIKSPIIPYTSPEVFWNLKKIQHQPQTQFIETDSIGQVPFTGSYGINLIDEIYRYALVTEIIATETTFDIIHAHDWLTYPAAIAAKKLTGKPLIAHIHSTDFDRSRGDINPKVYAIEREGLEVADKIITVSQRTKQVLIDKYNILPSKIEVVYNAVEPIPFPLKKKQQKSNQLKTVTFLGRITHQKGPEYFINAASLVLKKMQNVQFIMAGSGDMLPEMIKRVNELEIADKFLFTGFLDNKEVFEVLTSSDVYVMPSVSEPFGITALEAVQCQVPVVLSKQSGVAEILTNTIKVDYFDIYTMADAIYLLLKNDKFSAQLVAKAKKEVDKIEWVHAAKQVRKIYRSTIQHQQQ